METDDTMIKIEPLKVEPSSISSTPTPSTQTSSTSNVAPATPVAPPKTKLPSIVLPEVDLYLNLLVLLFSIDKLKHKQALALAEKMMEKIVSQNRRTLDVISAKCFFYYGRINEICGKLDQIRL